MANYEELARRAWKSGEYKAAIEEVPGDAAAGGDRSLRTFLRSKMEWIVEREGRDIRKELSGPEKEEREMKLARFVKFREEKFGGVLFETRSEKVFTLSPTGAAVVREIVAGGDEAAVIERLKSRFEDQDGAVEKEATEFIASLKEKGLVTE